MAASGNWAAPRTPHRELIEQDNADLFAGLNPSSWAAYYEAWAEADFFDLGENVPDDSDPMKVVKAGLLASLRRTGAIGSEHRKDMVETLRAAKPATVALGLPVTQDAGPAKAPKGGM